MNLIATLILVLRDMKKLTKCTKMGFPSLSSGEFTVAILVNWPEWQLVDTTTVLNPFIELTALHEDLVLIKWQLMSALVSLERFDEKDPFFKKLRSCRHYLQSECTVWPEPIWIKVRTSWQIQPQHQSTYLGGPESA